MFSTALVIFRETLEISLILGIVLAATRGVPQRGLWIAAGFAAGGAGAGLVAFFAQRIADTAEGAGQELFNAGVLLTAALVIGWTVLWMRRHAREMAANLKKTGQAVLSGDLPRYSLSVIIALALLREGSEIVLFIYGALLSGESAGAVASGAVGGICVGAVAGAAIYLGLIRLPVGKMLQFTSWLLMLLVAGLAAQAAAFLSAAGYFGELSSALWDSSWLLTDGSITGKALHTLIGYSAKPSVIQGVFYAGTLGTLLLFVSLIEGRVKSDMAAGIVAAGIVLALLTLSTPAAADTIHSPNLVKGEFELEYNGSRTVDGDHADNDNQGHEIEFAYTPLDRWKTELVVGIEKAQDEDAGIEEIEWENFFQFWEQGEKFVDAGLQLVFAHNFVPHEPDAIEAKLLLEKQTGDFLHRANIGAEQAVGGHSSGGPELSFLWSSRYRLNQHFEPGFELQSAFGQDGEISGSLDKQEHYTGPAAYGRICHNVKYEIAYLFGVTDGATDGLLRFQLEFEKFF